EKIDNDVPAYRGVSTAILKAPEDYFKSWFSGVLITVIKGGYMHPNSGFYVGTSPRVKPMTLFTRNIYDDWDSYKAQIGQDMNPAHIIRRTLIDDRWGVGLDPNNDIDDDSFLTASDTLYSESFGLSMLWDRSTQLEDFLNTVLKHIDAALYVDARTGKFVLKLIRDDYNIDDLRLFDESNIASVSGFRRRTLEEMPNGVTVKFWDRDNNSEGSITRYDIAMANEAGFSNLKTVSMKGIADKNLAEKVLSRELRVNTTPLASVTFDATREAFGLSPGDPFVFSWPQYGIQEVVMRTKSVEYGDFGQSSIRVEAIEDIFSVATAVHSAPPTSFWVSPTHGPVECPYHKMIEIPFRVLVKELGMPKTQDIPDDAGLVGLVGSKPVSDADYAEILFIKDGND
ncbi:MAG: phage tail protein, partial [Candidatus Nanohaloarchaea archaeon]